jgi:hypothetical protein
MQIDKTEFADAIEFVREIVRSAFWQIEYHTRGMVSARNNVKRAEELIERGKFDVDAERADQDGDGDGIFETVTEFACWILDDRVDTLEHHETQLKKAYTELAMVKIMLQRGNYTEINVEEIQKKVVADYDKPK